jgi:hypothetical protein
VPHSELSGRVAAPGNQSTVACQRQHVSTAERQRAYGGTAVGGPGTALSRACVALTRPRD